MVMNERKKAANNKWDAANIKRSSIALPVELHERMEAHTKKTGETKNGFIKRAIDETITRDDKQD